MGMAAGSSSGPKSEINVTPLVDVVLVLLIIFMVVQPLLQRGYDVQVPPNAPPPPPNQPPPPDQLIVSITATKDVYLNKQKVDRSTLQEMLRNRNPKVVFFSAEDGANYGDAMQIMDLIRNAGVGEKKMSIGLVMDWVDPTGSGGAAPATP